MSYPNETLEYREARNSITQLEMNARRALEEAAAARRRLPLGGRVPQDYEFVGAEGPVRLSSLFAAGQNSLAIYSWMFNEKMARPCPMCTAMIDSWDGIVRHVSQRLPLVIVADSPYERMAAFAHEHGWKNLRLLSTNGSSYSRDYFGVTDSGNAIPNMNIFRRKGAEIFHHWGVELSKCDVAQDSRGLDVLNPIFNLFDLTPEGRGDFYTKLTYPTRNSL